MRPPKYPALPRPIAFGAKVPLHEPVASRLPFTYSLSELPERTIAYWVQTPADAGVAAVVPRVGPLVGLFFLPDTPDASDPRGGVPVDFATVAASVDLGRYPAWFHGMLDHGIALAPGPYEVMFPSLAHTDADVEATLAAARAVAPTL